MAEIISENASKIPFPHSVEAIFDRVINGRKAVNESHTSLPKRRRNVAKDKSHEYFIAIVERAYDKLKPYVTVRPRKGKRGGAVPNAPESTGVTVENSFEGLTVEDATEPPDTGEAERTEEIEEEPPNVPPVQVERSQDELEDEFHFQIKLLLTELHKIQHVIIHMWESYREGKVDVVVPSLATNIAIDLVRQAEAEFEDAVARPKKYPASKYPVWTLPAVAYWCQARQFDANPIEELVKPGLTHSGILEPTGTDGPAGTEDIYFHSVFCGLRQHLGALVMFPGSIQEPMIGEMRRNFKWPEKMFRTIELMPQYQVAINTWDYLPVCRHDEISAGIERMVNNPKEIPLWATFGVSLFLDIKSALGRKMSRPFYEIQEHVKEWEQRISTDKNSETSYTADKDVRGEIAELVHKHLKFAATVDGFENHTLHNERGIKSTVSTTTAGFWRPFQKEKFFFLKRHPVRCGLMKHHLYSRLHELRFKGKQDMKEVTWLAHLYVAGKLLQPQEPLWPDMELAIYRQGIDHLFGGALPTTFSECLYKLKKANGVANLNTPRETYKAKNKRIFKSPRIMGNILSGQMEHNADETIYHILRRFICNPDNQRHLIAQHNLPANGTIELFHEPKYAELVADLGDFWLPADLIDLYFDWPRFMRTCHEELIPAIRVYCSENDRTCPITDPNTDMFKFALYVLEKAAKSEAEGLSAAEKKALLAPLMNVNLFWTHVTREMVDDGRHKTWKGDRALVKLVQTCGAREFFNRPGPAGATALYGGWKRVDRRQSLFWEGLKEGEKV